MVKLIRFLSLPLVILGFTWQFIAGSFEAGRILANRWMSGVAIREIQRLRDALAAEKDQQ